MRSIPYETSTDSGVSLVDAIHANRELVTTICHDMASMARCFSRVGNDTVAAEIESWIEPLMRSSKQVGSSYSVEINQHLAHSERMMFGLVEATMAGVKMGKREAARAGDA